MNARTLLVATGIIASAVATACDGAGLSSPIASDRAPTLSAASSGRSGELHIVKECSQYDGKAGGFCTITESNIPEIQTGSRVYYALPLDFSDPSGLITLDSDIRVVAPGNVLFGHCHVTDFARVLGHCVYSGGTGRFKGFSGEAAVTPGSLPLVARWDGSYSFGKNGDTKN